MGGHTSMPQLVQKGSEVEDSPMDTALSSIAAQGHRERMGRDALPPIKHKAQLAGGLPDYAL